MDKKQKTIDQLRTELDDIFNAWDNTIRETLDDPGATKNLSLLDAADQKLLSDYQKGSVELDTTNAKRICNLIQTLHKGLDKVELTTESLKATFSKPLTPDEAIDAFKKYIDSISIGKNRDNIRIILK